MSAILCVFDVEIKQIILQVSKSQLITFKQCTIPILQFYGFHLIICNLSIQHIEFIHYIFQCNENPGIGAK